MTRTILSHRRFSRSRTLRASLGMPAASRWGANAVNGVINVITTRPKEGGH